MALKSPADARSSRNYGVFWLAICYAGATFVALIATVFFTQTGHSITDQDAFETVFLDMARVMFHPLPAGLVLTAVLAAIMSTMSSQLLILSSSLIEDIYMGLAKKRPSQFVLINLSRTAVVVIAIIGALLAINPSDTILGLVGFAWAGFGSAFGPLVLFALYWKRLNAPGAIAGMITGAVVSIIWGPSLATSSTKWFQASLLLPLHWLSSRWLPKSQARRFRRNSTKLPSWTRSPATTTSISPRRRTSSISQRTAEYLPRHPHGSISLKFYLRPLSAEPPGSGRSLMRHGAIFGIEHRRRTVHRRD